MNRRGYWAGRDDFEYQGYRSPPRCNRDDVECRRAQRDYEDGYRAAERDAEEARAARRARETRAAEEAHWLEEERIRDREEEERIRERAIDDTPTPE